MLAPHSSRQGDRSWPCPDLAGDYADQRPWSEGRRRFSAICRGFAFPAREDQVLLELGFETRALTLSLA